MSCSSRLHTFPLFAFKEQNLWCEVLIKRKCVLYKVLIWLHRCIIVVPGQLLSLGCHRKKAQNKKRAKAPMMRPSGRDHKLSQLAAEGLEVNFDPDRCSFILQRRLILFIKCSVVNFISSTACTYSSIGGRARPQTLQLQFDFSSLT